MHYQAARRAMPPPQSLLRNLAQVNDSNWRLDHVADITASRVAPGGDRKSAVVRDLAPVAW